MDDDRSVSAEVINSIINKGATHISYLDAANVKPFMKVVLAYVNASALVRDTIGKDDLEDEDVQKQISELYKCYCASCTEQHGPDEDENRLHGVGMINLRNEIVGI